MSNILNNREMDRRRQQLQHEQQIASRERSAAEGGAKYGVFVTVYHLIALLVGGPWLAAFTRKGDQSLSE